MILFLMSISLFILISYLIGSIPTGYLIGKYIKKIDIRQTGSGNIGATNALRTLGPAMGFTVLFLDMLKGLIVILLADAFIGHYGVYAVTLCGLAAILGHIFTIFLQFKGGKGVATAAGVCMALMPIPFYTALFIFLVLVTFTRYVSVGSIFAAIILVTIQTITYILCGYESKEDEMSKLVFVILIATFIIIKHIPNIKRLAKGTENKISFKKKQ